MGAKPIEFSHTDSPPRRAGQLNQMVGRLCAAESEIGQLEREVADISPSGTPGDPGDLTVYFENGLSGP